jgi:hypothetical protein
MNAIVLARLRTYLGHVLHYQPEECNAIISKVRSLALMSGHDIDFRFANAGLGAGPEARVASRLITYALVGSHGTETTEYEIRRQIDRWLRSKPALATQF